MELPKRHSLEWMTPSFDSTWPVILQRYDVRCPHDDTSLDVFWSGRGRACIPMCLWHCSHVLSRSIRIRNSGYLNKALRSFRRNSFACWRGMKRNMLSCSVTTSCISVKELMSSSEGEYLKVCMNTLIFTASLFSCRRTNHTKTWLMIFVLTISLHRRRY